MLDGRAINVFTQISEGEWKLVCEMESFIAYIAELSLDNA